ncbi:DUF4280 domain-containing protein [Nitrosospira sp. Is2]|uniref:DUF4280 domain-containing protein n=1 Tax=Nitrosospira sp. Is2 TaxID=3080532 RepID=UPI0029538839|nr:DUF4280 domain-containing protein [Nitrosospira sp. Is2]WON73527.1 DUF4280 domain-containing protein [Nitrosospira sp. Is2]
MPQHVCNGAALKCSFGLAPGQLTVLPVNRMMTSGQPAATIMDYQPLVNVSPFGACFSIANPMVAAATTAALGILTPQPCIPVTVSPWVAGAPTVLLGKQPSLDNTCTLNCMWGGVINVAMPGQFTELIL